MDQHNKSSIADFSSFFVKRWRFTALLGLAVLLFGAISYTTLLKRDGFPSVDVPVVIVSTDYNVGDANQVNNEVTKPLEVALGEITEVSEVSSYTFNTGTQLIATLDSNVKSSDGVEIIKTELDALTLPNNTVLEYSTFDAAKVNGEYDMAFTISGEKSLEELTKKAEEISAELVELNSVLNAEPIYLTDTKTNINTGQAEKVQTTYNRVGIKEGDKVVFEDAISIGIKKKGSNVDAIQLSEDVREKLAELDTNGYHLSYASDLAELVKQNIDSLEKNAFSGLFAVVLIVLLFVNWRASIVTSIFIPTVMTAVFIGLYLGGYTLNVISLFALILVLGLLVDDAIVVVEAIDYQKQKGKKGLIAIKDAIANIGVADISGTVTTLLVFAPMLFISGILGDFIRLIPVTVIMTLILSLLIALTIIPVLSNAVIKKINNKKREGLFSIFYFAFVVGSYLFISKNENAGLILGVSVLISIIGILLFSVLSFVKKKNETYSDHVKYGIARTAFIVGDSVNFVGDELANLTRFAFKGTYRKAFSIFAFVFLSLVLMFGGLMVSSKLKFSIFSPPKDSIGVIGTITVDYLDLYSYEDLQELSQEQKVEISENISKNVERVFIDEYGDITERYAYIEANGSSATVDVLLNAMDDREITAIEISDQLNSYFSDYVGADIKFGVAAAGPPVSDFPFAMQIYADSNEKLSEVQPEFRDFISGLEITEEDKVVEVKIDELTTLKKIDGRQFAEIKAKFTDNENSQLVNLLQEKIEEEFTEERLNELGLEESSLGFDFGQESENQESFESTFVALAVALVVMYVLLVLQYNSFSQPLLIFLAIPLTFPGLFPGLYITDNPLSFFVMLGVIGLIGIVVNNSIMIVDYANQVKAEGKTTAQAISEAVQLRFRPIVTTSATTIAGLVPLAISDPFWEGLAFSIIFGILASSILIVLILPAYYVLVEALRSVTKLGFRKAMNRVSF